jgi:hypothetical protein
MQLGIEKTDQLYVINKLQKDSAEYKKGQHYVIGIVDNELVIGALECFVSVAGDSTCVCSCAVVGSMTPF